MNPTAAIIIIGNEILSGRTLDLNTQEIATRLGEIGISVVEARTIADDREMIINTTRKLSRKYDYVFTTGGIGPTHDDITAEAIAAAFDVPYSKNQEIYEILKNYYKQKGEELNSAREKMSFIPESSKLLYNDATIVPGFVINNVFVMAGIPSVAKAMFRSAVPMLHKGAVVELKTLEVMMPESKIAQKFEELQNKYIQVEMGSYPFTKGGNNGTNLVLRSSNYDLLGQSYIELCEIINKLKD